MLYNTTEFFKSLKPTSGINAKKALIASHIVENPLVEKIFRLSLDSKIRSGVIIKPNDIAMGIAYSNLEEFIEFYEKNIPFRKDEDRAQLKAALSSLSEDEADLAIRMVNKDLNVGVGGTVVNAELKKAGLPLIRILNPMKAKKEKEVDLEAFGYPAFAQEKIDAARAFIVIEDNHAYILSSGGEEVRTLPSIASTSLCTERETHKTEDSIAIPSVIDGEILFVDDKGNLLPRRKSNGMFNKAIKGSISDEEATRARFVAWDLLYKINTDEGNAVSSEEILFSDEFAVKIPYEMRFSGLQTFLDASATQEEISIVKSKLVYSAGAAKDFANKVISEGGEGAVLKSLNSFYEAKRSKHLVKIKKSYMADVRVVGLNEGKNAGTLGSLQYETDDGMVSGDVTGIGDRMKEMIWSGVLDIVGQVIEVSYMELSLIEKTGKYTLYGPPVFVRIRDDKKDTSTIEELS